MKTDKNSSPSQEDLKLINYYTRKELSAKEVYCFTLTLCDNEVDRDFERFSLEALSCLKELFIGKTGISDHITSSKNQKARIFKTWLETDSLKKTITGEDYTCLKARAYMLKTDENRELINEIEGGIKKEVSIGCAVAETICSVCGKSMKTGLCNHIKGKLYGKKPCHGILGEITDAYEWSFVAVPAQKNAGVTKSFLQEGGTGTQKLFLENNLLQKEVDELKSKLKTLEKKATDGELYRQELICEIKKYALISMPGVNTESLISSFSAMETNELKALSKSLKAQAKLLVPLCPQLKAVSTNKPNNENTNNAFKI